jgi:arabinose-5-phosphate isomerase
MGDALAIALLEARGFTADDFARSHPAGARPPPAAAYQRHHARRATTGAARASGQRQRGAAGNDAQGPRHDRRRGCRRRLLGVFTDGDLRRTLDDAEVDLRGTRSTAMTRRPRPSTPDKLAVEAAQMMEDTRSCAAGGRRRAARLVGALNIHDLLRARVV